MKKYKVEFIQTETFIVDVSNVKKSNKLRERLWDHWGYIERDVEINDIISVLNGLELDVIENRTKKQTEKNYFYLKE